MTQPGDAPDAMAETGSADGADMSAPMAMGDACQMAADMASLQREQEAGKVAMGGVHPAGG